MKKIAVCIPSFNEKDNIQNITHLIDESLCYLDEVAEAIIINCDNKSPDKTNELFEATKTKHRKLSILSSQKGKGINIYNFFRYMLENKIDYGFTIDADLRSFKIDWLPKMYAELKNGNNFVLPLYKREKEEGNTTNHFVIPMLYSFYGKFIRQPIGGDYGFDITFVKNILEEKFTENILKYGIDIFMVVTAIVKKMQISEVDLGWKKHAPSYNKMEYIFEKVALGFSEVYNHYNDYNFIKEKIEYKPFNYELKKCPYKDVVEEKYQRYLKENNLNNDYEEILTCWLKMLNSYKEKIAHPSDEFIIKLKQVFFCRSVSFWNEVENKHITNWENELIKVLYLLEGEEL